MSRNLLFVLLLATGTALAQKKPEAEHAAGAGKAQAKTEAARGQTKEAPAKTKAPEAAQAETKKPQGPTEAAQARTEAVPAQTEGAQGQTEEPQAQTDKDPKLTSVPGGKALGMSVLGNQEAPTSLVIVPWKSSEVGRSQGISPMLDDSRQPVDKEVFMRALRYYEIRSEKKP
jgi:hypothetical protein